jgi:hypothetical protein
MQAAGIDVRPNSCLAVCRNLQKIGPADETCAARHVRQKCAEADQASMSSIYFVIIYPHKVQNRHVYPTTSRMAYQAHNVPREPQFTMVAKYLNLNHPAMPHVRLKYQKGSSLLIVRCAKYKHTTCGNRRDASLKIYTMSQKQRKNINLLDSKHAAHMQVRSSTKHSSACLKILLLTLHSPWIETLSLIIFPDGVYVGIFIDSPGIDVGKWEPAELEQLAQPFHTYSSFVVVYLPITVGVG